MINWAKQKKRDILHGANEKSNSKQTTLVVNYFWTLSKMAEKSRGRSCSEPSNYNRIWLKFCIWLFKWWYNYLNQSLHLALALESSKWRKNDEGINKQK